MAHARVVLADDHPAVAKQLQSLLETRFEVVATVGDGIALIAAANEFEPDVIVTDVSMPGIDGLSAAERILERSPGTRIVIITVHDEPELRAKAYLIGACGYVLKRLAGEELVMVIDEALENRRLVGEG